LIPSPAPHFAAAVLADSFIASAAWIVSLIVATIAPHVQTWHDKHVKTIERYQVQAAVFGRSVSTTFL
jgi:hypothetical protein